MARLRITGWKHRRNLSLLSLHGWSWSGAVSLVRALTSVRVNLPFLLLHGQKGGMAGCVCLAQRDSPQAKEVACRLAQKQGWEAPQIEEPVIALTLYPLAGSMTLPAEALACLSGARLRPLALGTSLAAMTIVLPEGELTLAVDALREHFDLPPRASPPEEDISVVQSHIRRKG